MIAQRGDLVGAARRSRRRAAGGVVGEPLDDEPRQRRRELAQPGELDPAASRQRLVDERVEHGGLVAQDLGQREHVVRRARMDGCSAGTSSARIRLRAYASDSLLSSSRQLSPRCGSTRRSARA